MNCAAPLRPLSIEPDRRLCGNDVALRRPGHEDWGDETPRDQFVEMRKIALLILTSTLFDEDIYPYLNAIWQPILDTIRYISPGPWLVWRDVPQPRSHRAIERMDSYLRQLIVAHRASSRRAD